MKIGILGTRGIPNRYGGFEQCAEFIASILSEKGHEVWVYNSHQHPHKAKIWSKVKLIHRYDPEEKLGSFGQFIYDFNCLWDAGKRKFDVLLQMGYTSNAIWFALWPKNCPNVVNMDGMEWKRSKYGKAVKKFLKFSESLAVKHADELVADSVGVQDYLSKKYRKQSTFIPYGAEVFELPNISSLPPFLKAYSYDLVIARMEKENNIETIIKAFLKSRSNKTLVLIGSVENSYGRQLYHQYSQEENLRFLGAIYNMEILNNLRYHSHLYYHGHSVGGTNPSLLEAMASNAMIIAHHNIFNQKILGKDALYFSNENELSQIISSLESSAKNEEFIIENKRKIRDFYNWEVVAELYEKCLSQAIEKQNASSKIAPLEKSISIN